MYEYTLHKNFQFSVKLQFYIHNRSFQMNAALAGAYSDRNHFLDIFTICLYFYITFIETVSCMELLEQ